MENTENFQMSSEVKLNKVEDKQYSYIHSIDSIEVDKSGYVTSASIWHQMNNMRIGNYTFDVVELGELLNKLLNENK